MFGDNNYQLLWNERKGFAKLALETRVPIIPVFTTNLREACRNYGTNNRLMKSLYEKYHFALSLYIGHIPVKIKTIVGQPILIEENESRTIDQIYSEVNLNIYQNKLER